MPLGVGHCSLWFRQQALTLAELRSFGRASWMVGLCRSLGCWLLIRSARKSCAPLLGSLSVWKFDGLSRQRGRGKYDFIWVQEPMPSLPANEDSHGQPLRPEPDKNDSVVRWTRLCLAWLWLKTDRSSTGTANGMAAPYLIELQLGRKFLPIPACKRCANQRKSKHTQTKNQSNLQNISKLCTTRYLLSRWQGMKLWPTRRNGTK